MKAGQLKGAIKVLKREIAESLVQERDLTVAYAAEMLTDPNSGRTKLAKSKLHNCRNRIRWKRDTIQSYNRRLKNLRERAKA